MSSSDDLSHVCELETHLMRFEQAWHGEGQASISAVIEDVGSADRLYVLKELVKIDQEYHWNRGNRKRIEHYLASYPELQADDACVVELIASELTLGRQHGESFSKAEILTRFPSQAEAIGKLLPPDDQASSSATIVNFADRARQPQRHAMSQTIKQVGRYNICEELGRGAFAVVYRAWDPQLKRDVAIKIPRDDFCEMEELRERMLREAQAAANLKHPGIVPIYEVGHADNRFYIVSELVEGVTLAEKMRGGQASLQDICNWMIAVSEAAHYAHQCGVVHRDIKPANIIIRKDNTPALTDFGLARQSDGQASLTQQGDIVGTPAFMAPEQAAGLSREVDARSDVYSLGVVLYQLICGKLPFDGSTASVLHKVIYEEPQSPRRIKSEIPIDLDTICSKAIAKEPKRRYESALELADDLKRWSKHQPISARPVSSFGRLKLWCHRQPFLAVTMIISTLLLAMVTSFSYIRVVQERNRYKASLYQSLLSDARSQMQAKDTAWWWNSLENLGEAAQLASEPSRRRELRDLALEIMSNTQPSFRLEREKLLQEPVHLIEPDPSGRFYLAFDDASVMHVLSADSDEVLVTATTDRRVQAAAIHASGHWFLTWDGRSLRRWKIDLSADGQSAAVNKEADEIFPWNEERLGGLEFSPDGRTLAAGSSEGIIHLARWNENADAQWTTLGSENENAVLSLAWCDDNRILASGATDGSVKAWDTQHAKIVQQTGVTDAATVIAGTQDFWTLAVATDAMFGFTLFDRRCDSLSPYPSLHSDQVVALAHTQYGWLAASRDGSIALWSGTQRIAVARGGYASITSAFLAEDKKQVVASYADGYIRRWNFGTSPYATRFNTSNRAAFHPIEQRVAYSKGVIRIDEAMHPGDIGLTTDRFSVDEFSAFSVGTRPYAYVGGTIAGKLIAWEPHNLQVTHQATAHTSKVASIAFDRTSERMATAGDDGYVCVWDSQTFERQQRIEAELGKLHCVSIDQTLVAASGEFGAALWSVTDEGGTTEIFRASHHLSQSAIAILTDSEGAARIAFSGRQGNIRVVEVNNPTQLRTLAGHRGEVTALQPWSDSEILSAGNDMTLRLWRIDSEAEVRRWQTSNIPTWIATTESRNLLATGGTFPTAFLNQSRSTPIAIIGEHSLCFGAFDQEKAWYVGATSEGYLHYIPTDALPLGSHGPTQHGTTVLTTYESLLRDGRHQQVVWQNLFSPDGKWLATGSHDRTAKIWNATSLELTHTLRGHHDLVWSAAFSPDSKFLATGSAQENSLSEQPPSTKHAPEDATPTTTELCGDIRIWDVASGELVRQISGHDHLVRGLAYHPSGRWLVSCSTDGTILAWDVSTGKALGIVAKFDQLVHDVVFSPDGKRLAAACHDSQLAIIDAEQFSLAKPQTKKIPPPKFLSSQRSRVWAVSFSPDGEWLVGGSDAGEFTIWSVRTLQSLATIRTNATRARSLSFSRDGGWLATGNYESSQSMLWNLSAIKGKLAEVGLDW